MKEQIVRLYEHLKNNRHIKTVFLNSELEWLHHEHPTFNYELTRDEALSLIEPYVKDSSLTTSKSDAILKEELVNKIEANEKNKAELLDKANTSLISKSQQIEALTNKIIEGNKALSFAKEEYNRKLDAYDALLEEKISLQQANAELTSKLEASAKANADLKDELQKLAGDFNGVLEEKAGLQQLVDELQKAATPQPEAGKDKTSKK